MKGSEFTIERLLTDKLSDIAPRFIGGSMVIARLAPQDYHRWHFPVCLETRACGYILQTNLVVYAYIDYQHVVIGSSKMFTNRCVIVSINVSNNKRTHDKSHNQNPD